MEEIKNKSYLYKDKETLHWDNQIKSSKNDKPYPPIQNSQYTHIQFAELLASTIHQINELSKNKGEEYAGYGDDRLINFRQIANELSLNMEDVWAVYTTKHWRAVMQYIADLKKDVQPTRLEPISGRIDDLIVYCILLKAMIEERENR